MKYNIFAAQQFGCYKIYVFSLLSILALWPYQIAAQAQDQFYRVCSEGQNCNDADARRLQGAYDSSATTPEQRAKMIEVIQVNTRDGVTNWQNAARDYFAWRQGPVPSKVSSAVGVERGASLKAESLSAFKRRIDAMSFSNLMMFDASGLEKKKLKYLEEKKVSRQRAVDQAYISTFCSPPSSYEVAKCVTPIGVISQELCNDVSRCYVVKSVEVTNACPPNQVLGRSVVMAMGSVPPDSEPCNYRAAATGFGGAPILLERSSIDSFVREKYVTNLGGAAEKRYYIEIKEIYTLAIPIEHFFKNGSSEVRQSNLTIKLSGRYEGATTFYEDQILGVFKKLNELKPWFLQ